jgi:hypothetical protein
MSKTPRTGMDAFHGEGGTYTTTCACGATVVTVNSQSGPCNICGQCASALLAVVHGRPEDAFPLASPALVKCGLRADRPKAERVHLLVYLGTDTRHTGDGGFEDLHVYACVVCGLDRQTRKPPGTAASAGAERKASRRRKAA